MTPPIDPASVALRLKGLCELHGGAAELARACHLKLATLESCLAQKNLPGAMTLAQISAGIGVSVDWILFGEARP